eukprot:Opistho-2@41177
MYRAFALKRSIARVWSADTIMYYACQKFLGHPLHRMDEHDDPYRLGGDFILDSRDGCITLAHPSATPIDRPNVHAIITALRLLSSATHTGVPPDNTSFGGQCM